MRRLGLALFIVPLLLAACTWVNHATALANTKDWQGLQVLAERRIKAQPQDADAWFFLGVAYFHAGRDAQAIEAFRQALQINPKFTQAWQNLGVAYADAGQYAQGIDADRKALQINSQDADAWYNLGTAYSQAGQQNHALAVYQHLKTLDPALAQKLFDQIVPK